MSEIPTHLRCSFCRRQLDEVTRLISGPNDVCICDECVDLCRGILAEEMSSFPALEKRHDNIESKLEAAMEELKSILASTEQGAEYHVLQLKLTNLEIGLTKAQKELQYTIEETRNRAKRLEERLESFDPSVIDNIQQKIDATQDKLSGEIDSLSERLPGSFQDMTQQEIRRRLSHIEERLDSLHDRQDTRQTITLRKWQVWLAIVALILPNVVVLLPKLREWVVSLF